MIDPRLDCHVYMELARRHGTQITHIIETHRNEDYLIGSLTLAHRTGALVLHGGKLPFTYGSAIAEGASVDLGHVRLTVWDARTYAGAPGAAGGTRSSSDDPLAVFTGDCLFVGSTGRTDLLPGREEEMAGLLYQSLFEKLLTLPDGTLIHPAHGQGSYCGNGMSTREISTIGYERAHNPTLQHHTREDFVQQTAGTVGEAAILFPHEVGNLHGVLLEHLPDPYRLPARQFHAQQQQHGMIAVDVREPAAYGGAHVPGAWALPEEQLGLFAGWFLAYRPPSSGWWSMTWRNATRPSARYSVGLYPALTVTW